MILFLCSSVAMVSAQDIRLEINGQDISRPIIFDNGTCDYELFLDKGVYIKDMDAESDSKFLEIFIEQLMSSYEGRMAEENLSYSEQVPFPVFMPSGNFEVRLSSVYDLDDVQKTAQQQTTVTIPSTGPLSWILGILAKKIPKDVALEILNHFYPVEIERLPRELTPEELFSAGLDEIGLTEEEIHDHQYEIEKVFEMTDVNRTAEWGPAFGTGDGINAEVTRLLEEIGSRDDANMEAYLAVFKITNTLTGEFTFRTKIIITISSDIGIHDLDIAELIPKTTAEDARQLTYSEPVIILEADPIVKWNFNNLPPDKKKDYAYVAKKDVYEVESTTIVGGTEAGLLARFVRWCLNGGWMIVALLMLVLLIGGPIFGMKWYRNRYPLAASETKEDPSGKKTVSQPGPEVDASPSHGQESSHKKSPRSRS